MNCAQAKPLIQPYADGELDAARIVELELHIRDCPACTTEWSNLRNLKKAVKQDALFFRAPNELRQRIKADLRAQTSDAPERRLWNWNWLATAFSGVAAACLALLLSVTLNRPSTEQRLTQEIVSSHVRSLMASHELDVVSTDQHTVKPWFDGKLDFSPPVKNLAAKEFPLIGGRLDYFDGHAVAALVFQRNKHVINLFIWPGKETDSRPAAAISLQGYNLIRWANAGMTLVAVSDLNEKELAEFAQEFAR